LGVVFSLDFSVIKDTLPILVGAIVFGLVVVLSAGTLMLALSSLSRNSRYIGAFWIFVWLISFGVAQRLSAFHEESARREALGNVYSRAQRGHMTREEALAMQHALTDAEDVYAEAIMNDWRPLLSYTGNLSRLQSSLLNTSGSMGPLLAVFERGS